MPTRLDSARRALRGSLRLLRGLSHLLVGLFTLVFVFPRITAQAREQRVQVWSLRMLACLGIQLELRGQPCLVGPALLVANHISWLDITALHAARFCRFISKSDVKSWPLIGRLATGVGSLFIERSSRRDARRVVHQMTERLAAGDVLAVFPEGTTSVGLELLPFHANLFQPAIAAGVAVQPVAIEYLSHATAAPALEPSYVGNDSLIRSVWRTVCAHGIRVRMTFGPLQLPQGRDRRAWAHDVRRDIQALRSAQGSD